jgi:hypothetical protein
MDEYGIKRSMEQARHHLARAEIELQAAQGHLDPKAADESRGTWLGPWGTPGPWSGMPWRRSGRGCGSKPGKVG